MKGIQSPQFFNTSASAFLGRVDLKSWSLLFLSNHTRTLCMDLRPIMICQICQLEHLNWLWFFPIGIAILVKIVFIFISEHTFDHFKFFFSFLRLYLSSNFVKSALSHGCDITIPSISDAVLEKSVKKFWRTFCLSCWTSLWLSQAGPKFAFRTEIKIIYSKLVLLDL